MSFLKILKGCLKGHSYFFPFWAWPIYLTLCLSGSSPAPTSLETEKRHDLVTHTHTHTHTNCDTSKSMQECDTPRDIVPYSVKGHVKQWMTHATKLRSIFHYLFMAHSFWILLFFFSVLITFDFVQWKIWEVGMTIEQIWIGYILFYI